MKKCWKFLIGGILIIIGCGCFLYPNFKDWSTQNEVDAIINSFKNYNTGQAETSSDVISDAKEEPVFDDPGNRDPPDDIAEPQNAALTENLQNTEDTPATETSAISTAGYNQFSELYQAMVAYNQDLVNNGHSILDAWNYEQVPINLPDIDADNPVIGYIEIPDMDIRLPLLLGASSENLERGATVLSGTSMPVGGENTNCVIAAHRGWKGSAYFQYIEDLKQGSRVYITTPWETLVYEYRSTKVIYPDDVTSLEIQEGKDMITLFTCHPYQVGGGPYRYLVFCERVDTQETDITDEKVINPKTENVPTQLTEALETDAISNPVIEPAAEPIVDEEVDMIAVERTLRLVLPIAVIAFAVITILSRFFSRKRKRKTTGRKKEKADKHLLDKKKKNKKGGR